MFAVTCLLTDMMSWIKTHFAVADSLADCSAFNL